MGIIYLYIYIICTHLSRYFYSNTSYIITYRYVIRDRFPNNTGGNLHINIIAKIDNVQTVYRKILFIPSVIGRTYLHLVSVGMGSI